MCGVVTSSLTSRSCFPDEKPHSGTGLAGAAVVYCPHWPESRFITLRPCRHFAVFRFAVVSLLFCVLSVNNVRNRIFARLVTVQFPFVAVVPPFNESCVTTPKDTRLLYHVGAQVRCARGVLLDVFAHSR